MKRVIAALTLSLLAAPAFANVSPTFLPDFTFPTPVETPDETPVLQNR